MKKRSLIIFACFASFLPLSGDATPKAAYVWNQLAEGLRYATFSFNVGDLDRTTIHAFVIDPTKFRIDVITAGPKEKEGSTIQTLGERHGALIAINGGFFTDLHTSIGLLVQNGKTINKLHGTSWWSIFSLEGTTPTISRPSDYHVQPETRMAVQAGPRLVINGMIPKLKEGRDTRSAIGITREGHVLFVVTQGAGLTLQEFASRLVLSPWQGGLECDHAMNLDGGGSTQLYARVGKLSLTLPGFWRITNGIAVFPK